MHLNESDNELQSDAVFIVQDEKKIGQFAVFYYEHVSSYSYRSLFNPCVKLKRRKEIIVFPSLPFRKHIYNGLYTVLIRTFFYLFRACVSSSPYFTLPGEILFPSTNFPHTGYYAYAGRCLLEDPAREV